MIRKAIIAICIFAAVASVVWVELPRQLQYESHLGPITVTAWDDFGFGRALFGEYRAVCIGIAEHAPPDKGNSIQLSIAVPISTRPFDWEARANDFGILLSVSQNRMAGSVTERYPQGRRLATGSISAPSWAAPLVFAAYPILVGLRRFHRYRHRGGDSGLCLNCGYDLTGNTSGTCPECGTGVDNDSQVEGKHAVHP